MNPAARRRIPIVAAVAATVAGCDVGAPFRAISEERVVKRVTVTPESVPASVADTIQVIGTAIGTGNRVIVEAEITWSTGDPSVVRSLGAGRFVVLAVGDAELIATTRGRRGVARVVAR